VETGHGERLLPLREELVLDVDETEKALRMEIPEGLLDL
jgi:ribosomal 30S subunit maturation factor RimM